MICMMFYDTALANTFGGRDLYDAASAHLASDNGKSLQGSIDELDRDDLYDMYDVYDTALANTLGGRDLYDAASAHLASDNGKSLQGSIDELDRDLSDMFQGC